MSVVLLPMMENEDIHKFVYIWKIENYSFCCEIADEYLRSPSFKASPTEGSSWSLRIYSRGTSSFENYIGLYLERQFDVEGPVYVSVDYELSFLKYDGTPEYTAAEKVRFFEKGQTSGFANLVSREEVFQTKKSVLLPDDALKVQCRICFENIGLPAQIQAFSTSAIRIHRQLLLWDAGELNYISPFKVEFFSRVLFGDGELSVVLVADSIYIHIETAAVVFRTFRFRIGILDSDRSTSQFLIDEYIFNREKCSVTTFLISRSKLLQRKDLYLPQGRLILHCEITYSRDFQKGQIDCFTFDKIFSSDTLDKKGNEKNRPPSISDSKCSAILSTMSNDFHTLYQEETLSDFTIKVGRESLPVHKAVLCARSSVFKAMLTSNMVEARKNMVDISDLDVDTVRRMLRYMYSDTVNDLDWVKAKKLYFAADKYDIITLKNLCKEFFKINLITANIEDILELAHTHTDEDLKNLASEHLQRIIKR